MDRMAGSMAVSQRAASMAAPCQAVRLCGCGAPSRALPLRRQPQLLSARQQSSRLAASSSSVLVEEEEEVDVSGMEDPGELTDEMLEKDIQMLYDYFDELLEQEQSETQFKQGDRVLGTIFKVEDKIAFVDIGAKECAYLTADEVSVARVRKLNRVLPVNSQREFEIINHSPLIVSLKRQEVALQWERLRQIKDEDAVVSGTVISVNRSGVLVEVEHLRGFLPGTQLRQDMLLSEELVGREIEMKLLEVDEDRARLVFSARNVGTAGESPVESFKVGDVVEGVVQAVKPYGAFVDIGKGVAGLLHISQISAARISNVEGVLSEGDRLKVLILSQDHARKRVSLSTKKLEPSPGDMLRDPALVYEKADEMAASFRNKVAAAEAATKDQEERGLPLDDLIVEEEAQPAPRQQRKARKPAE